MQINAFCMPVNDRGSLCLIDVWWWSPSVGQLIVLCEIYIY